MARATTERIFGDDEDYQKMLKLIAEAKAKLPFYLCAYSFMLNPHPSLDGAATGCNRESDASFLLDADTLATTTGGREA